MLKRKGTLYEEFWSMIVVSRPNRTNFVGPSTTLQVLLANVTEVKVKNMATVVHKTREKNKIMSQRNG
jgi:hypothetical protein